MCDYDIHMAVVAPAIANANKPLRDKTGRRASFCAHAAIHRNIQNLPYVAT